MVQELLPLEHNFLVIRKHTFEPLNAFSQICVFTADFAHDFEKSTSSFGTLFFCNVQDKCRYRLIERFSKIKISFIFTAYNDKKKVWKFCFFGFTLAISKKI